MTAHLPRPEPSTSRRLDCRALFGKSWFRCSLLAIIGFLARLPALPGQLIWDDTYLARDNPLIKSPLFVLEVFRHYLFIDSSSPHYRPVQNLSYILDYALWNTETFGFHLTNVLLHVSGGVLLYFLLCRLLESLRLRTGTIDCSLVSFWVAALWVVHPVHSAAVDYISGRADSLAFVFSSAAWLLFIKGSNTGRPRRRVLFYLTSAICGMAALCSRESACIWFALFIVHVLVTSRYSGFRRLFPVLACCGLLSFYVALRQLPGPHAVKVVAGPSAPVRAVVMLRALGDYAGLMLFPANLHMERTVYDAAAFQNGDTRSQLVGFEYLSIVGLTTAVGMTLFCLRRGKGQPMCVLGAGWFLIGFLPVSNLFNLNAPVAEHWLYIPSVGFFIFLAGCALDLPRHFHKIAAATAGVAVLALGVRSFVRSTDWVDPETFYRRTAEAGGTGCRIWVNLGQIYSLQGRYAEAEKVYRNVLRIQPDYTIARNNLADALAHLGREDEAKSLLADATAGAHTSSRDYPRTWVAALSYSHLLAGDGNSAAALAVLKQALTDYPQTWELVAAQSEIFRSQHRFDSALALLKPFAEKNWWHYESWMALGRVIAETDDVDLAAAALRHASLLDIHSTDALNLIALMRMRQNRLDDAWRAQCRAVSRQPDEPRQYVLLSNILEKMGRGDEARVALAHVSKLRGLAASSKPD